MKLDVGKRLISQYTTVSSYEQGLSDNLKINIVDEMSENSATVSQSLR